MNPSKEQTMNTRSASLSKVALLNDALRCRGEGGRIMLTRGVIALSEDLQIRALKAVREFNSFQERNDPYGEHDCAIIDVEGHSILWKIDYYDTSLTLHSPDPANPDVTCRVLTIMLADEY